MFKQFFWGTLYGAAYASITGGILFTVLKTWPDKLTWLQIGVGLAGQFAFGIFTFMKDPERAWRMPPTAPMPTPIERVKP